MAASAGPSRPARGLLIGVAATVYAALAVVSGLDRLGANDPVLAGMLPSTLLAQSLRNKATNAQSIGDTDTALQLAREAVARTPIEPASTAVLGAAILGREDEAGAERVFRAAAKMGWRVPLTQLYWMQASLAVDDFPNAALRLDALLRQTPGLLANRKLLDPLEQSPEGRSALAERLVERPDWLTPYVADVWNVAPEVLSLRRDVLVDLATDGVRLGCEDISPFVQREVALADVRGARDVWLAHCPGARAGAVYDGDFARAQVTQTRASLAWTFLGNAGITVLPETGPQPGRHSLAVDGNVSRPTVFVRQLQLVTPGRYRLTWSARTEQGTPSNRVVAAFDCGGPIAWQPGEAGRNGVRSAVLDHDGKCDAPWLSFALAPGSGAVHLSGVALVPVARTAR
ncbi:tetratricopeptide repeat protein [Novosphingobium huizhouense]|uniref:tetratricopeptide repeat protein n=1 Tax=Novosphingobium huizhouense TaxID=2866625 RepID=UPI001CD8EF7C|nr:hypothetical protein [Novosphingobium huizhouense]